MKGIIRINDKLSSGGTVCAGTSGMIFAGREVARQGDAVFCPIPGHGANQIAEGDSGFTHHGQPIALDGHRCACGCVVLTSLPTAGRA